MEREVFMFRRGKGGLDELSQSANNQMRAVTVEGQIKSCPEVAAEAKTRQILRWECLTGKNWAKELERRSKKK